MRLELAPIGFARIVNEISVHPRPASPATAINVETDHPHDEAGASHYSVGSLILTPGRNRLFPSGGSSDPEAGTQRVGGIAGLRDLDPEDLVQLDPVRLERQGGSG